jgi:hypothetical protein
MSCWCWCWCYWCCDAGGAGVAGTADIMEDNKPATSVVVATGTDEVTGPGCGCWCYYGNNFARLYCVKYFIYFYIIFL